MTEDDTGHSGETEIGDVTGRGSMGRESWFRVWVHAYAILQLVAFCTLDAGIRPIANARVTGVVAL